MMGFGFRKSFGSGPFRFTVSPSGVSSSFGVKGARITSGPRGTFVTVSSHGVYYRKRIDTPPPRVEQAVHTNEQARTEPPVDSVFQVPINQLADSNQNELITALNANASATNPGPIVIGLSGIAFLLIAVSSFVTAIAIASFGLAFGMILSQRFKRSHLHAIHYSLDDAATKKYAAIQGAISVLESCAKVWALNTQTHTSDLKRNAGAGTLITRKPAFVGNGLAKEFTVSVPFKSLSSDGARFHFLPDQILIYARGRYASVDYKQFKLSASATRYVENEYVPRDSVQVDTTWRYVNKNGGPDRRFNNNRQLPILRYGEITLEALGGLNIILQTSNYEKAVAFVSRMRDVVPSSTRQRVADASPRPSPPPKPEVTLLRCYELLGLARPATVEQAATAHRHQAMLYHPDKYEHLAPEMKQLAAIKMQEINAAYERIKRDIAGL